jgi:hypothetical protein
VLGLPDDVKAVPFDLDGVPTDTASAHKPAWKELFDALLHARNAAARRPCPSTPTDYETYVDGKPRADGVRDFVASRATSCQKVTRTTPPAPRQSTVWATGRTRPSESGFIETASGSSEAPAAIWRQRDAGRRSGGGFFQCKHRSCPRPTCSVSVPTRQPSTRMLSPELKAGGPAGCDTDKSCTE